MGYLRSKFKVQNSILILVGFLIFLFSIFSFQYLVFGVRAEPNCDAPGSGDIDYCLAKIQEQLDALTPAHETNKQELAKLKVQLSSISKQIVGVSSQLKKVEADIAQREEDLAYAKEIFEEKTANHYKFIRLYDPLLPFLSSDDASSAFRKIAYRSKAASEDIRTMEKFARDLAQLKTDKDNLEKNKENFSSLHA